MTGRHIRVLALVTDAYGGRGGIAAFNRDMLAAMSASTAVREVIVLPRLAPGAIAGVPEKISFRANAIGSKLAYLRSLLALLGGDGRFDLIVCGHINLVPAAKLAAMRLRVPLLLIIHGIDAWTPPRGVLARRLADRVDRVVAVSAVTRDRFLLWAESKPPVTIVPNPVELDAFGAGPKPDYLLDRYGLRNRTILMTLGRLSSEDRYKGFDEVMRILPALRQEVPRVAYLIAGDGPDRSRLEALARTSEVSDAVIFAGYVAESEKADHYRLADAYVMPSRGEGFGRVYLEALASGIPVVASTLDGGREALLDGELGELVNPDDPADVLRGIRAALARGRGEVPSRLSVFSPAQNRARWHQLITEVTA